MLDRVDGVLKRVLVRLSGISVRGMEDTRAMALCLQELMELRGELAAAPSGKSGVKADD